MTTHCGLWVRNCQWKVSLGPLLSSPPDGTTMVHIEIDGGYHVYCW